MASKFGCQLTKRTESDLDRIVSYIAVELASPQTASDFIEFLKNWIFDHESTVETVCLLSNRKPDTTVKLSVDMDDYYRIKDGKEPK